MNGRPGGMGFLKECLQVLLDTLLAVEANVKRRKRWRAIEHHRHPEIAFGFFDPTGS